MVNYQLVRKITIYILMKKYIIGKWAFRKAQRNCKNTLDICLDDSDVFTEHIYMFSLTYLKKNIFKYISIFKKQ